MIVYPYKRMFSKDDLKEIVYHGPIKGYDANKIFEILKGSVKTNYAFILIPNHFKVEIHSPWDWQLKKWF